MSSFNMYNNSGARDPTAKAALESVGKYEREQEASERLRKMIQNIRSICDLAGIDVIGRITLQDRKTGKRRG